MSEAVNFKRLKNPEGRAFLDELQSAEENLSKQDAKPFFRTILPHFEYEISPKVGNSILKTIKSVTENGKIAHIFITNDFACSLPFSQKQYMNPVLDIMLQLVNIDPNVFTSEVSAAFSQLVSRAPDKCLTIIANFAQHATDVDDPLPLFDLLIKNAELYVNDENLVYPYLSLLAFANDNSADFKQKRLSKCSKILSLVMETDEVNVLKSCYVALKTYRQLAPPLNQIKRHLKSKSLQSTVLSYLVLSPPLEIDSKLLDMLLTIANSDVRGSYVLFQVCTQSEENAELLLDNEDWLRMSLPTAEDTLKLLLVVFQHHELRDQISQNPYFFKLLLTVVKKTQDTGVITVICTMMRRIAIDKSMMQELKEMEFLSIFFNKANENGENMAIHSGLLLTDTFAHIGFFQDFLELIEQICDIAKENGPLSSVAAQLLVDLGVYPKCMKLICRCGMESFFKKKMKDQKLRKSAQKFYELLEDGGS